MKIAIIGYGYVGQAYGKFFDSHDSFEVLIHDPKVFTSSSKKDINECDLAIVCVPTPMKEDGSCDTSIVEETVGWLETPLILVKSTVPPMTTEYLSRMKGRPVCFSPEFIGEGKYFIPYWRYPHPTDVRMHDFFIIGGEEPARSKIVDIFQVVMGPNARIFKMASREAEIIKYMENSWGAMKVTFANEFYEICKIFGADYDVVREGFLADGRTERIHTMVRDEARGFGGKCFPKDVNAIIKTSEAAGYEPKLLKQVLASNKEFRNETL